MEQKEIVADKSTADCTSARNQMWLLKISKELKEEWFAKKRKREEGGEGKVLGTLQIVQGSNQIFFLPKKRETSKLPPKMRVKLEETKDLDNQLKIFSIDEKRKYRVEGKIISKGLIGGSKEDLNNKAFIDSYIQLKLEQQKKELEAKSSKSQLLTKKQLTEENIKVRGKLPSKQQVLSSPTLSKNWFLTLFSSQTKFKRVQKEELQKQTQRGERTKSEWKSQRLKRDCSRPFKMERL